MTDPREALVAHLERTGMGYGLHDGLKREVLGAWADAILAEFDVTPRGERVKPSVEAAAREMYADDIRQGRALLAWEALPEDEQQWYLSNARAALALIPGRTEAEVKAEAWDEWHSCEYPREEDHARFCLNPYRQKEADRG